MFLLYNLSLVSLVYHTVYIPFGKLTNPFHRSNSVCTMNFWLSFIENRVILRISINDFLFRSETLILYPFTVDANKECTILNQLIFVNRHPGKWLPR